MTGSGGGGFGVERRVVARVEARRRLRWRVRRYVHVETGENLCGCGKRAVSVSASRIYAHGGVMEREAGGRGGLAPGRAPFVMLTWPSPLASTVSLESPPAPMSIEPNCGWPAGRETGAAAFNTSDGDEEKGVARSRRGDIEATRGWGRRSEQASRGSSSELDATPI